MALKTHICPVSHLKNSNHLTSYQKGFLILILFRTGAMPGKLTMSVPLSYLSPLVALNASAHSLETMTFTQKHVWSL